MIAFILFIFAIFTIHAGANGVSSGGLGPLLRALMQANHNAMNYLPKGKENRGTFMAISQIPLKLTNAIEVSSLCSAKYEYYMPQHMGGKRRSARIAEQIKKVIRMGKTV